MKKLIFMLMLLFVLNKSMVLCQEISPSSITSAGQSFNSQNIEMNFAIGEIVVNDFNAEGISISNGILATQETLVVLPLTLQNLILSTNKSNATLSWTTFNEVGTSYFNIEKSTDGVSFQTIGKENAIGNSSLKQDYKYTDSNFNTTAYYRLKVIDKDGKFNYSNILRALYNYTTLTVLAYPNPFANDIFVRIHAIGNKKVNITINNFLGLSVLKSTYTLIAGDNVISITGSNLLEGVYILSVEMDGTNKSFKIIKE